MNQPQKKFKAIYNQLQEEILSGTFAVGDKLPKETDLAVRFDCSLGTVSKALALLTHEGLVKRRARAGTTVTTPPPDESAASVQLDAFAFIYPSNLHEGIWRTVKGFQKAAQEAGRRVVMLTTGVDFQREAEFLGRLSEFEVRAAAIYPIIPTPQDQVHFSKLLVDSKFPIVLVEVNLPGLGCNAVILDGFHAGCTMTRHMIARGAKRIGFFTNYAWSPTMRDRYRGYCWALEEAGIPHVQDLVYLDSAMHPDFNDPLAEPTRMAEGYFKTAGKLDAVVCGDDFLAMGCIAAARKRGWKVPEDLLVSGIDDYNAFAASKEVPLTTYRIPYEQMGRTVFETINGTLDGKPGEFFETQLRGEIVIRKSA